MQCIYQRYHRNSFDSQADIQKPPATTGFDSKLLVKGLMIAGVITLVLAVLFALTAGFFISIPFQLNGMSIMHHI